MSETLCVRSGVPQGSVLGPLLFNIYINDLASLPLNAKPYMYADDTALLLPCSTYHVGARLMQEDVCLLMNWLSNNHIFLNKSKTDLICFHSPYRTFVETTSVFLHTSSCHNCSCRPVDLVHDVKYLGLQFDETLSWNLHIEQLAKRLRVVCVHLYALRSVCCLAVKRMVFKCLGVSIISYGLTIYGHASSYKLNTLNSILHKIARNIMYGTRHHGDRTEIIMKE